MVCATATRYERRLLDYSAFSDDCTIARQPCMAQVVVGCTHMLSRKNTKNGLDAAEIPVFAPRALDGPGQMNMNNFCHISLINRCKYTK